MFFGDWLDKNTNFQEKTASHLCHWLHLVPCQVPTAISNL